MIIVFVNYYEYKIKKFPEKFKEQLLMIVNY